MIPVRRPIRSAVPTGPSSGRTRPDAAPPCPPARRKPRWRRPAPVPRPRPPRPAFPAAATTGFRPP
ncbi:MAG: hypothetical protein C0447_03835, partial [Methylobacterium sp.]|nr:hypothetical protein [Methylobacterium sp.]